MLTVYKLAASIFALMEAEKVFYSRYTSNPFNTDCLMLIFPCSNNTLKNDDMIFM